MKKFKSLLISFLIVACAACLSLAFVACSGGGDKSESKYGYGEEGVYYYSADSETDYLMSLQSGTYMISVGGVSGYSGTYSYDESDGSFVFTSSDGEKFEASFAENAMQLAVAGTPYTFLKKVDYSVKFVDGSTTIATQSVTYGKSAEAIDEEKSGYIFLGWYEDAAFTTPYKFNTAVTGNLTLYAYYIEIDSTIANFDVNFVMDGETIHSTKTQNGVVYDIPEVSGILGWWVSDTNDGSELTYRYDGQVLSEATNFYAVRDTALGASVYGDRITWEAQVSSVNIIVDGTVVTSSATGNAYSYDMSALGTGKHTVEVSASGYGTENLVYVVNGLARVSNFSVYGTTLVYNKVENAQYYCISVTCANPAHDHTMVYNGNTLTYDFSNCEMGPEGITFTVYAYGAGFSESVSETFVYALILDNATVKIDSATDTATWTAVSGATGYEVYVNGEYVATTTGTGYSLKYYDRCGEGETIGVQVKPIAPGYYSEISVVVSYAKTSLRAPEITEITDYYISWTEVEGASGYEVSINGYIIDLYPAAESESAPTKIYVGNGNSYDGASDYYSYIIDGTNVISVAALADDGKTSQFSDAVYATKLSMSPVLSYKDGVISWTAALAAEKYYVEYEGTVTEVAGEISFDITFTHSGENTVKVYFDDDSYAEITVYAYAIVFDARGGENVDTIYVVKGDVVELPESSLEGYEFTAWYTLPDLTNFDPDATIEYGGDGAAIGTKTTFEASTDRVYYAFYTPNSYVITLVVGEGYLVGEDGSPIVDENGDYVSTYEQAVYYGKTFTLPKIVSTVVGNAVSGWYDKEDGNRHMIADANGIALNAWDRAEDMSLYAVYSAVMAFSETTYDRERVYSVTAGIDIDDVTEVTVPESYNGRRLILNTNAFRNCTKLEVVNIPDTIAYIAVTNDGYVTGSGAFAGCSSMKEVNIYATGEEAEPVYFSEDGVLFYKMSDYETEIYYYPYARALCEYAVPSTVSNEYELDYDGTPVEHAVTTIPSLVFRYRKISKLTVPSTVTYVESQIFYGNKELTEIVFAEGGRDSLFIADRAFRNCTALSTITLPARYTEFNADAFSDCSALTKVFIEDGGLYSSTSDGIVLSADGATLVYYPTGLSGDGGVVATGDLVPGVSTIGEDAFMNNTKITSVVISGNVTAIKESAFENCTGIESLTFAGTVESGNLTIETRAFYGCTRIHSVILPVNLTDMGKDAFGGCTRLAEVYFDARPGTTFQTLNFAEGSFGATSPITTLTLGANVPAIDFVAIFGDDNLLFVKIEEGGSYVSDDNGAVYSKDKTSIIYLPSAYMGDFELNENVTQITATVFSGHIGLTSVKIGESVNTIADGAFAGCTNLTKIIVDSNNTNYGNGKYNEEADGILYKKENDDITTLLYCPAACTITEMTIASTVNEIVDEAFKSNTKLTKVTIEATDAFELGEGVFYSCTNLTTVVLPECLTYIPENTFRSCGSLTSVNIPSGVTQIGVRAFYGCQALSGDLTNSTSGIKLPTGLTEIGDYSFYNCFELAVTIPYTVTTIGSNAFYNCWQCSGSPEIIFESTPTEIDEVKLVIGESAFQSGYWSGVTIPKRTTSIASGAFRENGYYNDVTIEFEDGCELTSIPDNAFMNVQGLSSITLPESITSIGNYAFYECWPLSVVNFAPEGKTSKIETIGSYAFGDDSNLTSITIPASVQKIDSYAFYSASDTGGQSKLATVNFEEGSQLEWIDVGVFQETKITEIAIPSSVTTINSNAFYNCTSLVTVTFGTRDGVNDSLRIGYGAFYNCNKITSITLPDGLTELANSSSNYKGAFESCTGITTIAVPSSVTTIAMNTFKGCTNLSSVTFAEGSSLESIGNYAFQNCTALTSFVFPETTGTLTLGSNIFSGSGVKSVTLSSSVEEVAAALGGVTLENIYIAQGNTSYVVDEDNSPILYRINASTNEKTLTYVYGKLSGDIAVPSGVVAIGASAYYGQTEITGVTIPSSVEAIGSNAFYGCTALTTVTFGDGAEIRLGTYAFYGCTNLFDINLPSNLTEIPDYCFYNCDLSGTTLPASLVSIGSNALRLTKIGGVDLPNLESIGTYAFYSSTITSLKVGALKELKDYAFQGCSALTEIEIAGTLNTICQSAFNGCTSLTDVSLPDTVTAIDGSAFNATAIVTIDLPSGLESTGTYTFQGCTSLIRIELPNTFTSMGKHTFRECTALADVTLSSGLTEVSDYAFYKCSALKNITLPQTITTLGERCFQYAGLESIDIPRSVTTIKTYAFANCGSLESFVVGSNVDTLGTYTFYQDTALVYAYTGDNVTSLPNYMFNGCTALETVEFGMYLSTIGTHVFNGCTAIREITLDSGVTTIGQCAFQGCTALESLIIPSTVSSVAKQAFNTITSMKLYIQNSAEYVSLYWTPGTSGTNTWNNGFSGTTFYYSDDEPAFNTSFEGYDGNYWYYAADGSIAEWTFAYTTYTIANEAGYVLYVEDTDMVAWIYIEGELYAVSSVASDESYTVTTDDGTAYTVTLSSENNEYTATVTRVEEEENEN